MKTFREFSNPEAAAAAPKKSFPTFEEALNGEKEGKTCMSESMMEKLNEMYESMCNEMKACHADETPNTAESYMKECSMKMNEMMENMQKACNECMN
jgi:hypothetical protein